MDTILITSENNLSNGPKDSSTPKIPFTERHDRNSLHVLKDSVKGNVTILGNGVKGHLEHKKSLTDKSKVKILFDKPAPSNHSVKIYEDSSIAENGQNVRCSRAVQTEDVLLEAYIQHRQLQCVNVSTDSGNLSESFDQGAFELMASDNIPETYWKDLAEQRRQALNDTLEENKNLSFEIETLKEENRRLSGIAAKAEQLENLLQNVLSDDDDDVDDHVDKDIGLSNAESNETGAEEVGHTDSAL